MKTVEAQKNKKDRCLLCACSFGLAFFMMVLLYGIMHIAPFGNRTLAGVDADIQYLDFFSYFQDVLRGTNHIKYSMTNTLGDGCIGIYSYYLASPFNLLVIFFKKSQLHTFLSLIVAIKISLSALTSCYYLQVRFRSKIDKVIVVLLSLGYAMMQYNLAQCSNVMWLDGVYMLPLILLGVHKVIENNNITFLSIAVALSILFNWYTAGINCVFSIFFFIIELLLYMCNHKEQFRRVFLYFIKYGVAMGIGVLMSAILFLPTVVDLRGGKGSSFDFNLIQNVFTGNIVSAIRDYTIGGMSDSGRVSLFAGSAILLGTISFFWNKQYTLKDKVVIGSGLFFSVVIYFYNPMFFLFSLFKDATSYWYRYSYIIIFFLMYVAALNYAKQEKKDNYIKLADGYIFIYLCVTYVVPIYSYYQVYITAACLFIFTVCFTAYFRKKGHLKYIAVIGMLLIASVELVYNAKYLIFNYGKDNVGQYRTYVDGQMAQLNEIKQQDSTYYRIAQLSFRNCQANLDESFGYNFWSNVGYTSCPDNRQILLLDHIGYKMDAGCINNVETSIVPADSLLGVKYVLSSYQVNGLLLREDMGTYNGKMVYENPYCLPMAFSYKSSQKEIAFTNPFEYQNELYSELYGENVQLYSRIEYESETENNIRTYHLYIPEGNYAVYGNIPWGAEMDAKIHQEGYEDIFYSCWMSQSVFYIRNESNVREITISLEAKKGLNILDEQFYVLDLDLLKTVTEQISEKKESQLFIENGNVSCTVQGKKGENLFLSIPYSGGWTVTCNGQRIEPELFGDCLMSIPLEDGVNQIEMEYHIPYLVHGIIISVIGIALLAGYWAIQKKYNTKKGKINHEKI